MLQGLSAHLNYAISILNHSLAMSRVKLVICYKYKCSVMFGFFILRFSQTLKEMTCFTTWILWVFLSRSPTGCNKTLLSKNSQRDLGTATDDVI